MKKKTRVLYFGTWGYGKAGLEALLTIENIEIVKLFTKWEIGAENKYFNMVHDIATENNIKTINTLSEKLSKTEFESEILNSEEIDIILSCCFDRFFSGRLLSFPKLCAINIHPSLLPKYRGVKPLENALLNGENEIGVTLHFLSKEMDAGDILIQKSDKISHDQTFQELYSLQCVQIKECIKAFFENPEKCISSADRQNDADKTFAPRLPFEISDNDTVADIIAKNREYNKPGD